MCLVSVPIRGLFNLTSLRYEDNLYFLEDMVSVPIRGLFNLTLEYDESERNANYATFPSPSGDYLI